MEESTLSHVSSHSPYSRGKGRTCQPLRLVLASMLVSGSATAAENGYLLPGYGVRANGMGGVGIALPQDSIAAAINPAGIGFVRDRLDVELAWNRLSRGASVSGSAAPINRDYDGNGRSNFVVPTMGYSYTVGPEMTLGVSIVGSGLNASYKTAIPLFGTSKASVDLRQVFISPSIAYKIAPEHALGIAVNLVQQSLKVEGLENFAGNSQLSMSPGNVTNRGYDSSYGLGLRLGYTGIITPWLTVGATYQPRIAMGRFDKYEGLIARRGELDIPTNYGVGVSAKPNLETTVALDINRIAYSGIPSIGNPLSRLTVDGNALGSDSGPGFGWRDMTIYKVGIDYAVTPKWTLRAGYNYGKQPIPQSQTFFNILAPVTTESYYTVGTTWNPGNSWEISAYYMYAPENKVRGNGSIPSAFGGGEADIRLKQQVLGVSLSWKY